MEHEFCSGEISRSIYELVHGRHGKFQLVGNCLHRKEIQSRLGSHFGHGGSFHINGMGRIALGQGALRF